MAASFKQTFLKQIRATPLGSTRGRYAPSPTGPLHLGNVQTAILAWLHAQLSGGKLLLRMDDLDTPRNQALSAAQIIDDLTWLGIHFDEDIYYESDHLDDYAAAFARLFEQGLIYPCSCSRTEIRDLASAPHQPGNAVRYPGTCRAKSSDDLSAAQALAFRFKVADSEGEIILQDHILGPYRQNLEEDVGDFVLKRKDGVYAYQLASVVDDISLGITDVVRGEDLLDSTPRQLALFKALDSVAPRFWHVPLKRDQHGVRLAKRSGGDSLLALREQGMSPGAVIGLLAYELNLIDQNQPLSLQHLLRELKQ